MAMLGLAGLALGLGLAMAWRAATRPTGPAAASMLFWPDPDPSPGRYRLDYQPFSPTLAHLADLGRLLVLPPAEVSAPPEWSSARGYAMSAIDRHGRLYHFDPNGSWWMDRVEALPEPLPPGGWDAAWNRERATLEILITDPWRGKDRIQLFCRRGDRWDRLEISRPPLARRGASRLFMDGTGSWLVAGGFGDPLTRAPRMLDGRRWHHWLPPLNNSGGPTPDLNRLWRLVGELDGGGVALLLDDGRLWLRDGGEWIGRGHVPIEGLVMARILPGPDRLLLVWSGGLGRDRIAVLDLGQEEEPLDSTEFAQIAHVRINEEDGGEWIGWVVEDENGALVPWSPDARGRLALKLATEYDELLCRAEQVQLIELPPSLDTLRPEGAAWVPEMGGLVVPAAGGIGLDHQRLPFSPVLTGQEDPGAGEAPLVDVIRRSFRFWIFDDEIVEFLKPPSEIHPEIGHLHSYQTPCRSRRSLSWIWPEPGILRYEYRVAGEMNEQWLASAPLTLRQIPVVDADGTGDLFLTNLVAWGDPAQVVVVGWSGRLGETVRFDPSADSLLEEAYTEVPRQGFMARVNALEPNQWEWSPLPIPFLQGARLIVDSVRNQLYLVGGKQAVADTVNGRPYQFMVSHDTVWQFDGRQWRRIEPGGVDPRMKITSDQVFHAGAGLLMSLTPQRLYGFDSGKWHELWRQPSDQLGEWPRQVGLYVHPMTGQTVGLWFTDPPWMGVWSGRDWIEVEVPPEALGAGALPAGRAQMLPAMHGEGYISLDAEAISAIRMNLQRDRDRDRDLTAWELRINEQ